MDHKLNPNSCNDLVFKYGSNVGIVESAEKANEICEENNEKPNNGFWDWNRVAGRCAIKHLSQQKFEAINILNDLIDGKNDELANMIRVVKEALLPERTIG